MQWNYQKTGSYMRLLWPLWHSITIVGIFWLTYKLRLVTDLIPGFQLRIPPIDTQELIVFAALSVVLFVAIGLVVKSYRFQFSLERDINAPLKQWFFWLVAMTFVAYFGHGFLFVSGISRFILIWTALLSGVVISLVDGWYGGWISRVENRSPMSVLCVYQDKKQLSVFEKHGAKKYNLTYLKADQWDDVTYTSYDFVIVVGEYSREKLQKEFDKIRLAHHTMYHVTDGHFLDNVVYSPVQLGGMSAYRYTPTRLTEWMRIIKRAIDFLGSAFGLVILSPILLLVSLAIVIDSRGAVLYKQKRIGRNGRVFTINKFRTMYTHLSLGEGYGGDEAWKVQKELMDSDANVRKGELQKIENDPRVTRIGRFLRMTSLDELPSLLNVLKGEMSLVGPRPHMEFEVQRYKPWQRRLLSMKPGITGYAQIKGRDALSFDDEANYDLHYMQHWSLRFDVYVLFMTLGVLLKGR